MTLAWLKKFWWIIVGILAILAGVVLVLIGKKQAAERLAAIVATTKAKAALEHLNIQNEAAGKALEDLASKRAAAEAAHIDQTTKLAIKLKETTAMTDDEVDAELKRRGHK